MNSIASHFFSTNDNAILHYLQTGVGKTIIMLPGAGFSADLFRYQIEEFSKKYKVISLDKREPGNRKRSIMDIGHQDSLKIWMICLLI
ncbi:MAG: hypothetical protein WBB48_10730 [Thermodesulfobacteriota bacterium]